MTDKKLTIFNVANDLSYDKNDLFDEAEGIYNAWMINKYFSQFKDTILIANEMNTRQNIPPQAHHDFLMGMVRKRKRFSKWAKKGKVEADIKNICEFYDVSSKRANQIIKLLNENQLKDIADQLKTGGKTNK